MSKQKDDKELRDAQRLGRLTEHGDEADDAERGDTPQPEKPPAEGEGPGGSPGGIPDTGKPRP